MSDPIEKLRRAVHDQGRSPEYHRAVMVRHRREWPTLWAAIDEMLAQTPPEANSRYRQAIAVAGNILLQAEGGAGDVYWKPAARAWLDEWATGEAER